jgi:hypothetical protein
MNCRFNGVREPAEIAADVERRPQLQAGAAERFFGYGVMGLPFRSGHVLGLRRFPASSIGPGYRSVWHRDAQGRWTFASEATVRGIDLGEMGPAPRQAHLRDFSIPQRGMFVAGRAMFTDPAA